MINITVNGQRQAIFGTVSVNRLLHGLGIDGRQVAVAVNGEVVPRTLWGETFVKEGDAVEAVRMVGGG